MLARLTCFLLLSTLSLNGFADGSVTIRCSFAASSGDTCTIRTSVYFIDEYEKSYASITSDNSCTFNFTLAKAGVATLTYRNQSIDIFLEPGDNIQLNAGSDSLYQSSFSDGAVQNTFLLSFYKTFRRDFEKSSVTNAILASDLDAFEMKLFEERKKQLEYYNTYKDKNSFSEAFKKYIENTIRYNYYASILSYPIVQANQSTQILTVKALPGVMIEGMDAKLINDEALNAASYRNFLYYYVVYFTSAANGFNKFKDLSLSMEGKVLTATKNLSGQSLAWYVAWFLNSDIGKVSQYTAQHVFGILNNVDKNGIYPKLLEKKVKQRLSDKDAVASTSKDNGSVSSSPGSSKSTSTDYPRLKDINGKYFSFENLKGKVVYVDYWASWCGPCRMQMPYSKQLHGMFTEQQLKDIVFLYISIDQSEDAWKAAVQQLGIEGKLAISPGNWQSEIAKFFHINSIPRYMLIDKKGNIVDLNAKRPSSGQEIYNDIMKLLE